MVTLIHHEMLHLSYTNVTLGVFTQDSGAPHWFLSACGVGVEFISLLPFMLIMYSIQACAMCWSQVKVNLCGVALFFNKADSGPLKFHEEESQTIWFLELCDMV